MGRDSSQKGSPLKTAITIGNFDGVHRGHVFLLERFKNVAETLKLQPVVLSFYGHPRAFKEALPLQYLLTTPLERKSLIQETGINRVEFVKLDKRTMDMSPEDFVKYILIERYNMELLFMGFNHHFGRNRRGTPSYVANLVREYNFSLMVLPPYLVNGVVVSSTLIRKLLKDGKIKEANEFLGRNYRICGRVVKGRSLAGDILGIKTANVELSPLKLIPCSGIYAVWVDINENIYPGALYIGDSPTLKNEFSFEVHIIGFKRNIYGEEICVDFVEKIRNNERFESVEDLRSAILRDIEKAKDILR